MKDKFGSSTKFMQGQFKPANPQKYKGDVKNIQFRSSWELAFMMKLDKAENIIEWSSEELYIGYVSPKDDKWHRYFPDFLYTTVDKAGRRQTFMVEIKPHAQTMKPENKTGKKASRKLINEAKTYSVNQAKWAYARKYCEDRGWKFLVLTEKELKI